MNPENEKLTWSFHLRKAQMPMRDATTTAATAIPMVGAIVLLFDPSWSTRTVGSTSSFLESVCWVEGRLLEEPVVAILVEEEVTPAFAEEVDALVTAWSVGSGVSLVVMDVGSSSAVIVVVVVDSSGVEDCEGCC